MLDHTDTRVPADRSIDLQTITLALAATEEACSECQAGLSCWLAQHGDPWTIVRLAGPVAADATRVVRLWERCGPGASIRDLLAFAFGPDVARIVGIIATKRDLAPAAALIQVLRPARRYKLIRAILDAIAYQPSTELAAASASTAAIARIFNQSPG